MAYENKKWQNNDTPLDADNMNNIMEGINLALGYGQGQSIPKNPIPLFKKGTANYSIIGNDLHNEAYGEYSTAFGTLTTADSYGFTAGKNNIAGCGAAAFGVGSRALAKYSFAAGYSVTALGESSISIGYGEAIVPNSMYDMSNDKILNSWETTKYHIAKGYQSIALGNGCIALNTGSMALGTRNASRGFFALASGCQTHAIGDYSATFGFENVSNGRCAVVVGEYNAADGQGTFVGGVKSNAHSFYGFAYGNNVHAYAPYSIAMGFESSAGMADKIITESSNIFNGEANGKGAIALGWGADATYDFSTAIGTHVKTSAQSQVVFGKFNADNPNAVFIVGDGISLDNKSNAFEVTSDKAYVYDEEVVTIEKGTWTGKLYYEIEYQSDTPSDKTYTFTGNYVRQGKQVTLSATIPVDADVIGSYNRMSGLPYISDVVTKGNIIKCNINNNVGGTDYTNSNIYTLSKSDFIISPISITEPDDGHIVNYYIDITYTV